MTRLIKTENLIVGTGAAGIAAAIALRDAKCSFDVIDVGYDLEEAVENQTAELAKLPTSEWDQDVVKRLFPPPTASRDGVERRFCFGSDYPYRMPRFLSIKSENCAIDLSHAFGGFGNVWGGALLPYDDHALSNWPITESDLKNSYEKVMDYLPMSAVLDGLQYRFPLYSHQVSSLKLTKQFEYMLDEFEHRKKALSKKGIGFGRARVAVDSSDGVTTCRYCGFCLDGCIYGSIFNPRLLWKKLESDNLSVNKGRYALEFKETESGVDVTTVTDANGCRETWAAKRVFLATGNISTARIIARSLGLLNKAIRIADSQYFFFPFFSYRGLNIDTKFTLAEMFIEILNRKISRNNVHFQIYGPNQIVQKTLRDLIPSALPLQPLINRLYIFQGFLHSSDSGYLEMRLLSSSGTSDSMMISGVENPLTKSVSHKIASLLRKRLIGFGFVPPFSLKLVPPGRSFHTGASFPMGGKHPIFSSDIIGRPAGLKRVHIVDPANFTNIPGSPITLTIMANADRIVNEAIKND